MLEPASYIVRLPDASLSTSSPRDVASKVAAELNIAPGRVTILDAELFQCWPPGRRAAGTPAYYSLAPEVWCAGTHDLRHVRWIACGSYNIVCEVEAGGERWALKTFNHWQRTQVDAGKDPESDLRNEVLVMRALSGVPGATQLIVDGTSEQPQLIVMDLIGRGLEVSLADSGSATPWWSEETTAFVSQHSEAWRAAAAVSIHETCLTMLLRGVCDRDKRWNIHFNESAGVVLFDFEFARMYNPSDADDWYSDLSRFLLQMSYHLWQLLAEAPPESREHVRLCREVFLRSEVFRLGLDQLGIDGERVEAEVRGFFDWALLPQ